MTSSECGNKKLAKYSRVDTKGTVYVDCSECERGGNGSDKDKCSCGWKIKHGRRGGCFIGTLRDGLTLNTPNPSHQPHRTSCGVGLDGVVGIPNQEKA